MVTEDGCGVGGDGDQVMYEVEKYQQLQSEKALQEKRCSEQRALLVSTHER